MQNSSADRIRRMCYRMSGHAFAMTLMNVPILELAITKDRVGEIMHPSFVPTPAQLAFAHLMGEFAASHSGVSSEIEPCGPTPDLAPVESLRNDVLEAAQKAMGAVSRIAETLLEQETISMDQFYLILDQELARRPS